MKQDEGYSGKGEAAAGWSGWPAGRYAGKILSLAHVREHRAGCGDPATEQGLHQSPESQSPAENVHRHLWKPRERKVPASAAGESG